VRAESGVSAPRIDSDWPGRDVSVTETILAKTPDVLQPYVVMDGVDPNSLSEPERQTLSSGHRRVLYKGLHARALLRIFAWDESNAQDGDGAKDSKEDRLGRDILSMLLGPGFTPNAYLLSSRTIEAAAKRGRREQSLTLPATPSVAAAEMPSKIRTNPVAGEVLLFSGQPLYIPPPRADGGKPRGLIIHLQSTAYNEYEPKVLREFKRRGWAVLDIATETDILTPIPEEWIPEILELNQKARALWDVISAEVFTGEGEDFRVAQRKLRDHPKYEEYRSLAGRAADLSRGAFVVCDEAAAANIGRVIASEIDDVVAGSAYAAEAVVEYIDAHRPDLQGVPVVLMGFSAGALVAPTVAVRLHERLDAMVLIGGGANLFEVTQGSTFKDGGVRLRCDQKKPSQELVAAVDRAYLEASKLDPYHTAPLVRDIPTLQVHAKKDTWVPAHTGELLYERLGRPDRLSISAGHELLFYRLPGQRRRIADWVERAAGVKK
jgi:pimeloyl-ACP methyl ester carboxylesterase